MIVVFDKNYSQLENESVLKYKKSMDPKGRLSSEIHFLVPLRKNKKKEVFRKKIGVN
jgi:hypothetical protein